MYARVTKFAGLPPERIEATLRMFREEHLPAIQQLQGYEGVQVLVDRAAGRAMAVTYWAEREDLAASAKQVQQAREAAVSTLDPERPPIVDDYEVLLTDMSGAGVAAPGGV